MHTIKRRMSPAGGVSNSSGRKSCPDFFELEDGNFILIGKDITDVMRNSLPEDAACGNEEKIVLIPRALIVSAKDNI
jgi:hypothetical protein